MKAVEEAGLAVCRLQGKAFEASAAELPQCGSAVFVRRFMRSDLARRLDAGAYESEVLEARAMVHEVDDEYGNARYGSQMYATEALYWMGYVYRYWCLAADMSSKAVYAIAGAREMRDLYFPYHTLDPMQAIGRILESKGLRADEDQIARGVRILRAIRAGSR